MDRYKVTKSFGSFKEGQILRESNKKESKVIKRKLQEGGCLKKMNTEEIKNKMIAGSPQNKAIKNKVKGGK